MKVVKSSDKNAMGEMLEGRDIKQVDKALITVKNNSQRPQDIAQASLKNSEKNSEGITTEAQQAESLNTKGKEGEEEKALHKNNKQEKEQEDQDEAPAASNDSEVGRTAKILAGIGLAALGGVALAGGGGGGGNDGKAGSSPATPTKVDPSSKEEISPIQKLPSSPVLKDDPINLKNNKLHAQTEPGNKVIFYIEGKKIGEGIADAQGNASVEVKEISDGKYSVYAVTKDAQDNLSSASETKNILVDRIAPELKSLDIQYVDAPDNNVKTISGEADPDAKKVRIRLAGESEDLIADVVDGKWSYSFDPPLKNTGQEFSISIIDKAGNSHLINKNFDQPMTPDTPEPTKPDTPVTPDKPELSAPTIQGHEKGYVNANDKQIKANTAPNTDVNLVDATNKIWLTDTSDSEGNVVFNIPNNLPDGTRLFLKNVNADGSFGEPSRELTVDLTPPKLKFTADNKNGRIDKVKGIFIETEPNIKVHIVDKNSKIIKTGTSDEYGNIGFSLKEYTDGDLLQFQTEDDAGNKSETPQFKIDTLPSIYSITFNKADKSLTIEGVGGDQKALELKMVVPLDTFVPGFSREVVIGGKFPIYDGKFSITLANWEHWDTFANKKSISVILNYYDTDRTTLLWSERTEVAMTPSVQRDDARNNDFKKNVLSTSEEEFFKSKEIKETDNPQEQISPNKAAAPKIDTVLPPKSYVDEQDPAIGMLH